MTAPRFIHLRLHSAYSLLEGRDPGQGARRSSAQADGMPAVALTDTGNLFAALEFSETLAKAGIQPIMGCQLALAYAERGASRRPRAGAAAGRPARAGRGRLRQPDEALVGQLPRLRRGAAARHARRRSPPTPSGLICLTGGAEGPLGTLDPRGPRPRGPARSPSGWRGLFPGRLYVEIQRHPENGAPRTPAEEATEPGLVGARLRPRPAAGRHQRRAVPRRRRCTTRTTRCSASPTAPTSTSRSRAAG